MTSVLRLISILLLTSVPAFPAQTLYAIADEALYRIDDYASRPTAVKVGNPGNPGLRPLDIGGHPITGELFAPDTTSTLHKLDPVTGLVTPIGPTGVSFLAALDFDRSGQAFGWASHGLYTVNTETGAAAFIGDVGYPVGGDLAFDVDGTLYGATRTELVRINPLTGAGTLVGSFGIGEVFSLEIDAAGMMYILVTQDTRAALYLVDKSTGRASFLDVVAGETFVANGLAFVPEPATWLMLVIALCGCNLSRKRWGHW